MSCCTVLAARRIFGGARAPVSIVSRSFLASARRENRRRALGDDVLGTADGSRQSPSMRMAAKLPDGPARTPPASSRSRASSFRHHLPRHRLLDRRAPRNRS